MTYMNYYLGVQSLQDAQYAIDKLSSGIHSQIQSKSRINMTVGPASADNDMTKGVMIWIGGEFTQNEMAEIDSLGGLADNLVTDLVVAFVAKQAVNMRSQDLSSSHTILGQEEKKSKKKWWQF